MFFATMKLSALGCVAAHAFALKAYACCAAERSRFAAIIDGAVDGAEAEPEARGTPNAAESASVIFPPEAVPCVVARASR